MNQGQSAEAKHVARSCPSAREFRLGSQIFVLVALTLGAGFGAATLGGDVPVAQPNAVVTSAAPLPEGMQLLPLAAASGPVGIGAESVADRERVSLGRLLFFVTYVRDPKKRGPGFMLTMLPNLAFVVGTLVVALRSLLT